MSDIVKELLSRASDEAGIGWTPTTIIPVTARLLHHAADRIEQLEAELTIQYQDGHHDGYEKGCTISKEASERYDRIDARIQQLEAALRPLACTCEAKHQADCSRAEVDCPFWNARTALGEEHT